MLISDDYRLKVPKIAKEVARFLANVHKDGYIFNTYNNTVLTIVYWTIAFWRKFKYMQRNKGDMIIKSSTYVSFECSITVAPRQRISNIYIYLYESDQSMFIGSKLRVILVSHMIFPGK